MLPGDAVRERMRKQVAQRMRRCIHGRRRIATQASPPLLGCRIDRGQRGAIGIGGNTTVAERRQRLPALGQRIAARAQRIARFDQGGEVAGQRDARRRVAHQQHRRQPRMRAQRQHAPAARGDRAGRVERIEPLQQVAAGGECAGRRRINEAQGVAAPGREFQRQRGQFDLGDFRPALRFQPLRLRPQPIRPAFGDTAGTTGALLGRGLRNRDHVQPRKPAVRIEARLTREAAVDHHAHAGQGHRRFGDIGRQHHPAAAIVRRLQHARLLFDRQFAVQKT